MKISKKDALTWFRFFASLPEEEEILTHQMEIVYATLAQIEDAVEARYAAMMAEIPGLRTMNGRTYFVGDADKFPKGCRSCLMGTGLSAIRKTNKCNAACKFCYDYGELDNIPPVGEGYWEIGGAKYRVEDVDLLLSIQGPPSGVAYVYLEPFMEIGKYYPIIRRLRQAGVYQHMYTNGLTATADNLKALGEAGLDELRFNLGASRCAGRVLDAMKAAKRFIPAVGVETPMTPEFFEDFARNEQAIAATGLDFINCAQLHLNANNIGNYLGENMYMYRLGYLSPVWSRELTLRLMKTADAEQWDFVVHDCSNRTKFARDINLGANEKRWFGSSGYGAEFSRVPFDAFLPILEDDDFHFLQEEPLPAGYRPGDIVL